jgi:hypothetical protein
MRETPENGNYQLRMADADAMLPASVFRFGGG